MNAVTRFLTVQAQSEMLRQPDVFARTAFVAVEIHEATVRALDGVGRLKAARAAADRAAMRQACNEVSKLLGQAQQLVAVAVRALDNDERPR